MRRFFLCVLLAGQLAALAAPARLKDLVTIQGVRENQLVGYGVVVGLAGTGDKATTIFTTQSLSNLLEKMGVAVAPSAIRVANVAAVMVTATLPPFAQPGAKIDVTASAIGDAKSLQGGILLMTSLRGADGETYAVAQGPVVTGGFVAGRGGNTQTVNHPTVGRIPEGGAIERPAPSAAPTSQVNLSLRSSDFATSARIAEAVNRRFSGEPQQSLVAKAVNPSVVALTAPPDWRTRMTEFIAYVEETSVEVDRPARIVVNERTGTIVLGGDVHISPVAILHGNLTVEISTQMLVSQPAPLSQGSTQVVPQETVTAKEEPAHNVVLKDGATVEELVKALTAIGSSPRDIIAILQSLRAADALNAELEVI